MVPDYPEILHELSKAKDHPEWLYAAGHRVFSPWNKDRIKFAFNDPSHYNNEGSVNPDVLVKILEQLGPSGTLSEKKMVELIEQFSSRCNRDEWKNFYQPVLQRRAWDGVTPFGTFNSILPGGLYEKYQIKPFEVPPMDVAFPSGEGFFYPFNEYFTKIYVFVFDDYVTTTTSEFTDWNFPEITYSFTDMMKQKNLRYPLVFEGICEGYEIFLTDVFEMNQIKVWPGALRRQILEDAYLNLLQDNDRIILGEGLPGDASSDLDEVRQHMTSLGYGKLDQILFKPAMEPYSKGSVLVPAFRADQLD